jgi:hypothetical protein
MKESELKAQALNFILRISENSVALSDADGDVYVDNLENILNGAQQIYEFLVGKTK